MTKEATIKIRPETRDRLRDLGKKGQSYDNLINNMLDLWINSATVLLSDANYYAIVDMGEHYGSTLNEMIAYILNEYACSRDELFKIHDAKED